MSMWYLGIVNKVDDPLKLGRVRCVIPGLTGTDAPSGWAYQAQISGSFLGAEIGDTVLILALSSGPSFTLIVDRVLPKAPQNSGSNLPRASEFEKDIYPQVKIMNWGAFEQFFNPSTGTLKLGSKTTIAKVEMNSAGETTVDGTKVFLGTGSAAASRGGI